MAPQAFRKQPFKETQNQSHKGSDQAKLHTCFPWFFKALRAQVHDRLRATLEYKELSRYPGVIEILLHALSRSSHKAGRVTLENAQIKWPHEQKSKYYSSYLGICKLELK